MENKTNYYKFKDFTYNDLCELWIKFYNENGRYPNTVDMQKNKDLPTLKRLMQILGDRFDEFDETYMRNIRWRKNVTKETFKNFLRRILNNTWKVDSIKKYNRKCAISGELYDDVHHLFSFNKITKETLQELGLDYRKYRESYTNEEINLIKDLFIKKNYDYGLGVCLTRKYHNEFHSIFGRNPTPEDFWKYKYYKDNNLDINELGSKVHSIVMCHRDQVTVYKTEIERILELKAENSKVFLFAMLILSKMWNNKQEFYLSYSRLKEIVSNIKQNDTLKKCADESIEQNLLYRYPMDEVKREYREKGFSYRYKPVNKYKLLISDNKSGDKIKFNVESKNIEEFYYPLLLHFYKKEELNKILTKVQYGKLTKLSTKLNNENITLEYYIRNLNQLVEQK